MTMLFKVIEGLVDPGKTFTYLWRRIPIGSFRLRLAFDAYYYMGYAFGIYEAALLAERLRVPRISAVEFGVAGGNGLLAMEEFARQVEKISATRIEIYGFDTGEGLPEPIDYRDLPYEYGRGHYRMDEARLRSRLTRSELLLGDVRDTVPKFLESGSTAPLGFVSFDLDYYSSTAAALKIFESGSERTLPRVYCYFDDVIGPDWVLSNEWVGQLRAIKDFNASHEMRKLAPIYGLRHKRVFYRGWNDRTWVLHDFENPRYNDYVAPIADRQLPLEA